MRSHMLTGLTVAGGSLAALAAPAGAATPLTADLPGAGEGLTPLVRVAKTPLIRRDLRLARQVARVNGTKLKARYARTIRAWSIDKLARHHRHLKRELRAARRAAAARSTASPALQAIAACESGGNPRTDTGNGF